MLPIGIVLAASAVTVIPQPQIVRDLGGVTSFRTAQVVGLKGLDVEAAEARKALLDEGVGEGSDLVVKLQLGPTKLDNEEAYDLSVTTDGVTIVGKTAHGVFNGIQSLRQMVSSTQAGHTLPHVLIEDAPRFAWRGFMLDNSRHFFGVEDTKHFIDVASRYKINTFHWHLNDDGGWRVEIKKYPELTRRGAFRVPANGLYEYPGMNFPEPGSKVATYGNFFTQDQVRDVVAYAAKKHVNVVPEIEVPGHNLAICVAYPWLVCSPSMQEAWKKESTFEFPNILCAGKERTYKFVEDVIDEMLQLFPSEVIHIGGDEVDKYLWNRCPDCRAKMKEIGTDKPEKLETYFVDRVLAYLKAHGRDGIGWDEITEGGLPEGAMVMSWRGVEGGIAAARLGHRVVMSPADWVYVNTPQSGLSIDKVYKFDPIQPEIPEQMRSFVIGGEACLWTETIPDRATVDSHLFPRLLALSQVLWTPSRESFEDFNKRLRSQLPSLARATPDFYLEPVRAKSTFVAPGESAEFEFEKIPGATVRYRVSTGSEPLPPDAQSPAYTGPIKLPPGAAISAAYVRGNKVASLSSVVRSIDLRPIDPAKFLPGLSMQVFPGKFESVPSFAGLKAELSRSASTVAAIDANREWYAQSFTGFFVAEEAGVYEFSLGADDGAVMKLSGSMLIDNNGLHGYVERKATVKLKKGAYALEIGYFNAAEAGQLTFRYAFKGGPMKDANSELRHAE